MDILRGFEEGFEDLFNPPDTYDESDLVWVPADPIVHDITGLDWVKLNVEIPLNMDAPATQRFVKRMKKERELYEEKHPIVQSDDAMSRMINGIAEHGNKILTAAETGLNNLAKAPDETFQLGNQALWIAAGLGVLLVMNAQSVSGAVRNLI